jgi:hypothetical protein
LIKQNASSTTTARRELVASRSGIFSKTDPSNFPSAATGVRDDRISATELVQKPIQVDGQKDRSEPPQCQTYKQRLMGTVAFTLRRLNWRIGINFSRFYPTPRKAAVSGVGFSSRTVTRELFWHPACSF